MVYVGGTGNEGDGIVRGAAGEVGLATALEYNLRAEGFTVRIAHGGRPDLASAAADPLPDVIVLDLTW